VLRGFPKEPTVDAGGRLVLHVATDAPSFSLRLERWSDGRTIAHDAGSFAGENAPAGAPDRPWEWPSIEVALPPALAPGAYVARFCADGGAGGRGGPREDTPDARWGTALFVVRGPSPARVLLNLPLFTYHAYNVAHVDATLGVDAGACLYTGPRTVTLRRPGGGTGGHPWDEATVDDYDRASPRQTFAHWDLHALQWFADEGIAVDVCTDLDLHRGDVDLGRYAVLCMFGHDEYWTREKRARVEAWLEGGGNVAFFSGNTCWGRVRYDEATASITRDGQWDDDPEDSLTGLSWRRGGGQWVGTRPPTGYRIERSDHALLRDADLRDGAVVGADASLVGYEFDGVDPARAPPGLIVLGRAEPTGWDVVEGTGRLWPGSNAAMVTFRRGRGVVFNAGTADWARALAWHDPHVAAITRSVIGRLSSRAALAVPPPARAHDRRTGTIAPSTPRDIVFLIGMSRSGTSALARVFSLCGGAVPLELLPPNFANPTGYWEPLHAVEINDEFLQAHGSSWHDARLTLQMQPVAGPPGEHFIAQIIEILDQGFHSDGPIILKEPRITALLPYWTAAATELQLRPVFVHIFRNPADVAASLSTRDGLSIEHSFALWLKYNLIGERETRGFRRLFVSYEDVMHDWEPVVARCAAEMGIEVGVEDATRRTVSDFLSPALHHHRTSAIDESAVDPMMMEWVSRVYAVLRYSSGHRLRMSVLDQILYDYVDSGRADASFLETIA
jgi:hypothetical protein